MIEISHVFPVGEKILGLIVLNDKLWIATDKGLYVQNFPNSLPEKIIFPLDHPGYQYGLH